MLCCLLFGCLCYLFLSFAALDNDEHNSRVSQQLPRKRILGQRTLLSLSLSSLALRRLRRRTTPPQIKQNNFSVCGAPLALQRLRARNAPLPPPLAQNKKHSIYLYLVFSHSLSLFSCKYKTHDARSLGREKLREKTTKLLHE